MRLLIERRQAGTAYPQALVAWSKDGWIRNSPEHEALLHRLPGAGLTREVIAQVSQRASRSPVDAARAFLAAMIWGYGRTGYGAWRTNKVLTTTENSDGLLREVAEVLETEGALAAYRLLGNSKRLKWLGPAFGTKYLYFCPQAEGNCRALILDRLVAGWLRDRTGLEFQPVRWSTATYESYLRTMHSWANDLGVPSDVIEEAIFVAVRDAS